jgi:hypothetical protein
LVALGVAGRAELKAWLCEGTDLGAALSEVRSPEALLTGGFGR